MREPTILILTAVRFEAKALASALGLRRVSVNQWQSSDESVPLLVQAVGIRATHLTTDVDAESLRCIILGGLAGALDPQLKVGDVVIDDCPAVWRREIQAHFGPIHCADQIIATADHKGMLFSQTRAIAVDMESRVVRGWATELGVPFVSVRAISDSADQALDPALPQFIDTFGSPKPLAMTKGLLSKPARIRDLIRLGKNSRIAAVQLGEAVRQIVQRIRSARPDKFVPEYPD